MTDYFNYVHWLRIKYCFIQYNLLVQTTVSRGKSSSKFQGMTPSPLPGGCWWLGKTKTDNWVSCFCMVVISFQCLVMPDIVLQHVSTMRCKCCKLYGNILQKYFYLARDCSLQIENKTFVVAENQESFGPSEIHPPQFEWCWYTDTLSFTSQQIFCHYLIQIT
jgi:hypothetical protein